jgi:hypothetical protein
MKGKAMTTTEIKPEPLDTLLRRLGASLESINWSLPYGTDWRRAWDECARCDFLLCIAARVGIDRRKIVLAGCRCARLSLKYIPEGESRPLALITTIEAWTRGEAALAQVKDASIAAYLASDAAADAAAYAIQYAEAAAHATRADATAAYAAKTASWSATAAARDAITAASEGPKSKTLAACADIIRQTIIFEEMLELVNRL